MRAAGGGDAAGGDRGYRVFAHIHQRHLIAGHGGVIIDFRTQPPRADRIGGAHPPRLFRVAHDGGDLVPHELRGVGVAVLVEQQILVGEQQAGGARVPLLLQPCGTLGRVGFLGAAGAGGGEKAQRRMARGLAIGGKLGKGSGAVCIAQRVVAGGHGIAGGALEHGEARGALRQLRDRLNAR